MHAGVVVDPGFVKVKHVADELADVDAEGVVKFEDRLVIARVRLLVIVEAAESVQAARHLEDVLHPVLDQSLERAVVVKAVARQVVQQLLDRTFVVDVIPDVPNQAQDNCQFFHLKM